MTKTLTAPVKISVVKPDADAEMILRFYREAEKSAKESFEKARLASRYAMICGRLLTEKRESMKAKGAWQGATKPEAEKFLTWLATSCPEISQATAYRYMTVADRVAEKFELPATTGDASPLLLSQVLATAKDELPEEAQQLQQAVFDFCADKTITQLLNDAVLDPDSTEAETRFKRALNGKTKGGTHAKDDRKDFPKFIGRNLTDAGSHLARFNRFSALQKDQTFIALDKWIEKLPTTVLQHMQQAIKEEAKKR